MKKINIITLVILVWILPMKAYSLHVKQESKNSQYEEMVKEADAYMNDYNILNAIPLYEKALKIKSNPNVIRSLSKCYYSRGCYRQSLNTINRMPADSINHRDLRLKYDCYDNLSLSDSALVCSRIIANRYIYDSENIANIAGYFNSIEKSDSALYYTKLYRSLDSTNLFVNRQQAYAYYNAKNFRDGMREYSKLIDMGDSTLYTCFRMGLCCNGCDSLTKAYPYFLCAAKLSKFQNPNILTQLGKSCITMGLVNDGIHYLKQALDPAYASLDVLYILNSSIADGYFKIHDYKTTIIFLKDALTCKKTSYITMFKIGQAYELNNDFVNAKQTYKSLLNFILKIDNPSESIKSLIKLCQDRLSQISTNTK